MSSMSAQDREARDAIAEALRVLKHVEPDNEACASKILEAEQALRAALRVLPDK